MREFLVVVGKNSVYRERFKGEFTGRGGVVLKCYLFRKEIRLLILKEVKFLWSL